VLHRLPNGEIGRETQRCEDFGETNVLIHGTHVLRRDSKIGTSPDARKQSLLAHGLPLIRVKPKHLARAAVERVGRVVGVRNGLPMLEDERVLEVENVIWCTGFRHGFDWIDLPVLGETEPLHERGVVTAEPGLYFVGLMFLYAASSAQIHGLSRDAERVANRIAAQTRAASSPDAGRRPTLDDARLRA